jgi:hypothetical protein
MKKIVVLCIALVVSFSAFSASQAKEKVTSIKWTVTTDKDTLAECQYSSGKVRLDVMYWKKDEQKTITISTTLADGYSSKVSREMRSSFKTMKDLNKFLIDYHDTFFNLDSEEKMLDFLKKNAPKKTVIMIKKEKEE